MAAGGVAGVDYLRGVLLMSDLRKAAQQALGALEKMVDEVDDYFVTATAAIENLRAALAQPEPDLMVMGQIEGHNRAMGVLAQPEQEPVAIHQWRFSGLVGQGWYDGYPHDDDRIYEERFLYTAPPQPDTEMPKTLCGPNLEEVLNAAGFYKRKPLTDAEMDKLFGYETERGVVPGHLAVAFVRIVERAHGIE